MKFIRTMLLFAACAVSMSAHAAIKVLATTPEWGALTTELGGDKVNVYVATTAFQDPHRIDAKPSLIARARSADLIVAVGAQLEIGWLPVLLQESGNAHVQPGAPGYFEADAQLKLLEVPTSVDRSLGDIHPLGNPHAHLDPHNVACCECIERAPGTARCGKCSVLPVTQHGLSGTLETSDRAVGVRSCTVEERADRRDSPRSSLLVQLARSERARSH